MKVRVGQREWMIWIVAVCCRRVGLSWREVEKESVANGHVGKTATLGSRTRTLLYQIKT